MAQCPETRSSREVHQGAHSRQKAGRADISGISQRSATGPRIESWRELQSQNIEFTMKRLREPIDNVG
jgi:hypothetical protein